MANAPSIKRLAVSIMACTPGMMWKVPSTLDKEPSIRSLAPIIATRAPNIMIQAPKMIRRAPRIRKQNIIRQLWRSIQFPYNIIKVLSLTSTSKLCVHFHRCRRGRSKNICVSFRYVKQALWWLIGRL